MSTQKCYHCGEIVTFNPIKYQDKEFCCSGCKSVYKLLSENNLGNFYQLETQPGTKPSEYNSNKYNFLDVEAIRSKFIEFEDENISRITLHLPTIHCSSCIYLLENIAKIEQQILSCQVNFSKREATLLFHSTKLPLSQLADLLDKIGYAPNFGHKGITAQIESKQYLYKLGIAGFAFGSIMLWSFPEYLGIATDNPEFRNFSSYLSFLVSLPVLFYSAQDYFISAYKAIRFKSLNLDVPITIGIIALYAQSVLTIFNDGGPGYMDSFAGFIFFLLIGKWFQNKTYRMLSFDRDYTSYFPLAITRVLEKSEEIVEVTDIKINNIIALRNDEVLPCDSILLSDEAKIDYSFVTGESNLVSKKKGDFIYAGGRLVGYRIILSVKKESNRSQLTRMWDEMKKDKVDQDGLKYQSKLSLYFLIALLIVGGGSAIVWAFIDPPQIIKILVSILIVACPCALALSGPFTFGNIMRLLGRKGLYIKNVNVIERMNQTTDIVFDKTGTLTVGSSQNVTYVGDTFTHQQKRIFYTLSSSSTHPMSRFIAKFLNNDGSMKAVPIENFRENIGEGIEGTFNGETLKLGSSKFCGISETNLNETASYITFSGKMGRFIFSTSFRPGIEELLTRLNQFDLHLVSGDNEKDKAKLTTLFPKSSILQFNYSPNDKLEYIQKLQSKGKSVIMIGDGLNDAGALAKADVGIAVSEDIFRFTPSSDAIIKASELKKLDELISTSAFSKTMILACMIFSISYNFVGLTVAISGNLSPLVAAILMPISSITVVFLSTGMALFRK